MRLTDKQLTDAIRFGVEVGRLSRWHSVTLVDILEVSGSRAVSDCRNVSPAQFERVISAVCNYYGIRRIVPTCVSLDRLETFFTGEGHETAVAVRKAMRAGFERRRGVHVSHDVADYLERVLKACGNSGLYGVESLYPELPDVWYLNAGDPYTETLIYNSDIHQWSLGCWGDIVERAGL